MFAPEGLNRLEGCLPELKAAELKLREIADSMNLVYRIPPFGGLRTDAEQAQLVEWRDQAVTRAVEEARRKGQNVETARSQAWYPVADVRRSKHGVGAAFDIQIVRLQTGRDTTNSAPHKDAELDAAYRKLADRASAAGLRAGYYFRSSDPFHFELPSTLQALASRWSDFAKSSSGTVAAIMLIGLLGGILAREFLT